MFEGVQGVRQGCARTAWTRGRAGGAPTLRAILADTFGFAKAGL